jgi:hypothetical protein
MNFDFDSILNHNTGPKKITPSASFGMLRDHWIVVPRPANKAAFYRSKRTIRSLDSSSELVSATASASRRLLANFSAK